MAVSLTELDQALAAAEAAQQEFAAIAALVGLPAPPAEQMPSGSDTSSGMTFALHTCTTSSEQIPSGSDDNSGVTSAPHACTASSAPFAQLPSVGSWLCVRLPSSEGAQAVKELAKASAKARQGFSSHRAAASPPPLRRVSPSASPAPAKVRRASPRAPAKGSDTDRVASQGSSHPTARSKPGKTPVQPVPAGKGAGRRAQSPVAGKSSLSIKPATAQLAAETVASRDVAQGGEKEQVAPMLMGSAQRCGGGVATRKPAAAAAPVSERLVQVLQHKGLSTEQREVLEVERKKKEALQLREKNERTMQRQGKTKAAPTLAEIVQQQLTTEEREALEVERAKREAQQLREKNIRTMQRAAATKTASTSTAEARAAAAPRRAGSAGPRSRSSSAGPRSAIKQQPLDREGASTVGSQPSAAVKETMSAIKEVFSKHDSKSCQAAAGGC